MRQTQGYNNTLLWRDFWLFFFSNANFSRIYLLFLTEGKATSQRNDQYCQHYITFTYFKISDFIEGMDQNALCSLCSNKENHCSYEEMLPVRVSADNCRGGAVSSARWLLCYTLVYRQHQENTLLHTLPLGLGQLSETYLLLYLNPQSIQCDSFLVFCHYNLFCPF